MRFTPVTIFGQLQQQVDFPVSGALCRFEPALYGNENPVGNNISFSFYPTASISESIFVTDPTASVYTNNVVESNWIEVSGIPTGSNFGTVMWVWRLLPIGAPNSDIQAPWIFDFRDGPHGPDGGIADAFIELDAQNIGALYQSSSYYTAFGNEDLQKYEINLDNIVTNYTTTTGSQSFPGFYKNDITGSAGTINNLTGTNAYRFAAFSPNNVATGSGDATGTYRAIFMGNDEEPPLREAWTYDSYGTVTKNIAAVAIFDTVLSDSEVRDVFNYYTSSLGLEIGL